MTLTKGLALLVTVATAGALVNASGTPTGSTATPTSTVRLKAISARVGSKGASLVGARLREAEREAFEEWIRASALDPKLRLAPKLDPADLAKPLRFPVAIAPKAPKGRQELTAKVVYFYCSKREGWCRRGTAEVEFTVEGP